MKADMDRKTASKSIAAGTLPSAMAKPHDWRTRPDPFKEHWPEIEARLRSTPELEAKTLFELLQNQHPGRHEDGQLRTLQRHVKRWRPRTGRSARSCSRSSIAPGKRRRPTSPTRRSWR